MISYSDVKGPKDKINFQIVAHEIEAPFLEQGDNKSTAANWYGAKIQPFNVDLKISGTQSEIFWEGRLFKQFKLPDTRLFQWFI